MLERVGIILNTGDKQEISFVLEKLSKLIAEGRTPRWLHDSRGNKCANIVYFNKETKKDDAE